MSRHAERWLTRLLLIVVVPFLTGCTKWEPIRLEPDRFKTSNTLTVRVTLLDGRQITLHRPIIVQDSLLTEGETKDVGAFARQAAQPAPPAIPLRSIGKVELQKAEPVGTVLLVGLGLAAVAAAAVAISLKDYDPLGNPDCSDSCPLIDSWTGTRWALDSGTFGGAIFPALTRTDLDNLPNAVAIRGEVRLRLRDAFDETEFVDALTLLAVDHAPGVTVAPTADGALVTLGTPAPPLAARDFRGADALEAVRGIDDLFWESSIVRRNPDVTADIRDGLELEFARPADATRARLVVDGNSSAWAAALMYQFVGLQGRDWWTWTRRIEADSAAARAFGHQFAAEAFLAVSVLTDHGWEAQGTIPEAGPEVSKRQVFSLDLSRTVGNTLRVRLESAPLFWTIDRVALDAATPAPVRVHRLEPATATDRQGADIRPRLRSIDRHYFVMERGDSADVTFHVPPIPAGLARSYLAQTTGWYRIHGPSAGEPQAALIERLGTEPFAISRIAVEKMNRVMSPAR